MHLIADASSEFSSSIGYNISVKTLGVLPEMLRFDASLESNCEKVVLLKWKWGKT